MRYTDRARVAALTVLAAVAGLASAGAAVLARDGLCIHRLLGLAMPAASMPGMAMDEPAAPAAAVLSPCPLLLFVALVAAVLFIVLLGAVREAAAGALAAAFRLLVPGADAPWALGGAALLIAPSFHVARRRPSRAPPLRT
jgi:hypothetical protein